MGKIDMTGLDDDDVLKSKAVIKSASGTEKVDVDILPSQTRSVVTKRNGHLAKGAAEGAVLSALGKGSAGVLTIAERALSVINNVVDTYRQIRLAEENTKQYKLWVKDRENAWKYSTKQMKEQSKKEITLDCIASEDKLNEERAKLQELVMQLQDKREQRQMTHDVFKKNNQILVDQAEFLTQQVKSLWKVYFDSHLSDEKIKTNIDNVQMQLNDLNEKIAQMTSEYMKGR